MFHVSTLLPHSKVERQQLERKRHIGNDIVAIVFQEHETTFNPECIASQFLHVYLVITPLDTHGTHFKVSVIYRDSVPPFGPGINPSNSFSCDQRFKQWILTKLINAEMASCRSISFQKYQVKKESLFLLINSFIHSNRNVQK
jgi:RAP1 GTPase activating protein 1